MKFVRMTPFRVAVRARSARSSTQAPLDRGAGRRSRSGQRARSRGLRPSAASPTQERDPDMKGGLLGAVFPNSHAPSQAFRRSAAIPAGRHHRESVLIARRIHPYEQQKYDFVLQKDFVFLLR